MKRILLILMVILLAACAGRAYTSGSVTFGTHGGSVSGTVSGPGAGVSGTVTLPPAK